MNRSMKNGFKDSMAFSELVLARLLTRILITAADIAENGEGKPQPVALGEIGLIDSNSLAF